MTLQAVILAGGLGHDMFPLTSPDAKHAPKCMIPVAMKPMLAYPIEMVEKSGFEEIIVVAPGDAALGTIRHWIQDEYSGHAKVEVVAVPEDCGTAGAIREVLDRMGKQATSLLVLPGDLVSDVPIAHVVALHQKKKATATVMFSRKAPSDPKAKKKPPPSTYVGLDTSRERLLYFQGGARVKKDLTISRSVFRHAGSCSISTDLADSHLYVLNLDKLVAALEAKPEFTSLRTEVLPYLVSRQFSRAESGSPDRSPSRGEIAAGGSAHGGSSGELQRLKLAGGSSDTLPSAVGEYDGSEGSGGEGDAGGGAEEGTGSEESFGGGGRHAARAKALLGGMTHNSDIQVAHESHGRVVGAVGGTAVAGGCYAFVAEEPALACRINTVASLLETAREVAAKPGLMGAEPSRFDNYLHETASLGSKSTVGAACVVGAGVKLGDKSSVKRSVIGYGCQIGNSCKIVNCVIMANVTIEDGAHLSHSVVCSHSIVRTRATIRDCTIGPGNVVGADEDIKGETMVKNN